MENNTIHIQRRHPRCERLALRHFRRMDKGLHARIRIRNAARPRGLTPKKAQTPVHSLHEWWNKGRAITRHNHRSNDFFRLFLDPTMTWSGAYFEHDGMDLEEAQQAKYQRLCQQLHLQTADHVLDLGCGWGESAIYIARHYGCKVTALTTSEQQYQLASIRVAQADLGHLVSILQKDYRQLTGSFDKIISIEIQEPADQAFFRKCRQLLKQDGIMAMQLVTQPGTCYTAHPSGEMTLIDLQELGLHYAATLKVWFMHFNSRLAEVRKLGFDDRFIRKWNYYLCSCEAAFRTRSLHAMQLVYQPSHQPVTSAGSPAHRSIDYLVHPAGRQHYMHPG